MTVPESVWEYPRPPRVEPCRRRVRILHGGTVVVDTTHAMRVLETSHPPGIYVPGTAVAPGILHPSPSRTLCEFKGVAWYWTLRVPGAGAVPDAAWSYETPTPGYEAITGLISFFPGRVDACLLDDEEVTAQPGDFYGGWITADISGPFKGGPGTMGW